MKKIILFGIIAALCLGLVACSPASDKSENGGAGTSAVSADAAYTFTYRDVKIALGGKMEPVAKKLGEPKKYFESESCAFQGLDKVYTYDGVVIRTYPQKDVDYVLSVEFKDDTVSTEEGVGIGDTREKVEKVYGAAEGSSAVYTKGGVILTFLFGDDGTVSSVTYTLASQSAQN